MTEKKATLRELAVLVGGEVSGDETVEISGFAPVELAGEGELTFLIKPGKTAMSEQTGATAVIIPEKYEECDVPCIKVENPNLAGAVIHNFFVQNDFVAEGIHRTACIGENCTISENITIGANVVVGDNVCIGDRVFIDAGVVIHKNTVVGDDCIIRANTVIEQGCELGKKVILHPGVIIGADGFGFATDSMGRHTKKPHVGIVRIGDNVEIGANSTVDRAAFGVTEIKAGTKIDNLVQVGHNVQLGEGCLLAAQVGISGSSTLGRNVVLGGQVGLKDHIHLADGCMVAAKSGLHGDLKKGEVVAGYPAIALRDFARCSSAFQRLPDIRRELKQMKKELAELKESRGDGDHLK